MLDSYIGNIWNNKKIKAEQSKKWLILDIGRREVIDRQKNLF